MKKKRTERHPPHSPKSDSEPTPSSANEDRATSLYMQHLEQAWADIQSMSDEFDKSILTYSSLGLGVSLAFIKDVVPLANAVCLGLLYASWIAFATAIVATVFSFPLSMWAQEKHVDHLKLYYIDKKQEYLNAGSKPATWLKYFRWLSGTFFVLAIVGTIWFCILNVNVARNMTKSKDNDSQMRLQEGRDPIRVTPLEKGRPPMAMTPLAGGPPPSAVPPQPATSTAPAPPKSTSNQKK
ncbi:MAG: hypothetical protein IH602_24060 [Bryobacteraceae bacterium]|nr:hypothetical protein [Bryobacteraceae bacterium]